MIIQIFNPIFLSVSFYLKVIRSLVCAMLKIRLIFFNIKKYLDIVNAFSSKKKKKTACGLIQYDLVVLAGLKST